MGAVADAALEAGGEVVGVITDQLVDTGDRNRVDGRIDGRVRRVRHKR